MNLALRRLISRVTVIACIVFVGLQLPSPANAASEVCPHSSWWPSHTVYPGQTYWTSFFVGGWYMSGQFNQAEGWSGPRSIISMMSTAAEGYERVGHRSLETANETIEGWSIVVIAYCS